MLNTSPKQELEYFDLPPNNMTSSYDLNMSTSTSKTRLKSVTPKKSISSSSTISSLSSNSSKVPQKGKAKRTRTGCLTCRKKHRKCDEIRKEDNNGNIKCKHCMSNDFDCEWPDFIIVSRSNITKLPTLINNENKNDSRITTSNQAHSFNNSLIQFQLRTPSTASTPTLSSNHLALQHQIHLNNHQQQIESRNHHNTSNTNTNTHIHTHNITDTNDSNNTRHIHSQNSSSSDKSELFEKPPTPFHVHSSSSSQLPQVSSIATGLPKTASAISISSLLALSPALPSLSPNNPSVKPDITDFLTPSMTRLMYCETEAEATAKLETNKPALLPLLKKPMLDTTISSSESSSSLPVIYNGPTGKTPKEDEIIQIQTQSKPHRHTQSLEQNHQSLQSCSQSQSQLKTQTQSEEHHSRQSQTDPSSASLFSPLLEDFEFNSFPDVFSEPLNISDFSSMGHEDNFLNIPDTLREILFTNALGLTDTQNPELDKKTKVKHPPKEVLQEYFINVERFIADNRQDELLLTPEQEWFLMSNYINEVAAELDMFDNHRAMVNVVSQKLSESSSLKYAVFALTSRRLERKYNYPKQWTIKFYHESLKYLARSSTNRDRSSDNILIVVTCIVLCVFEMMSSDPRNWKRHLEGCVLLLKTYNVHGFSKSIIERSLFWVFIRMDICNSVISESPTILPSKGYFEIEDQEMNDEQIEKLFKQENMHANYIVYINSRVMNLIYGEKEGNGFKLEWIQIWKILNRWSNHSNEIYKPAYEFYDEKTQFPRIGYANEQAISSTQMYHMACILMLQNKPRSLRLSTLSVIDSSGSPLRPVTSRTNSAHSVISTDSYNSLVSSSSPIKECSNQSITASYHARRIVGISITNDHYGAYCNSIQPLFVAGCYLGNKKEHGITLGALRNVEEKTNWSTHWRCRDLINYWGD